MDRSFLVSCRLLNIEQSAARSLSEYGLNDLKNTLWWAARRELSINRWILKWNVAEAPDAAHLNIGGNLSSSLAALDIQTATVPGTMTVAILPILRLSLRAMVRRQL
jgi:hypothetical protein